MNALFYPLVLLAGATALQSEPTHRDHLRLILPAPEELAFEDLDWRPALWTAALEANIRDRPILLWAMNGHPLACT
jgi:hypothetical protein